MQLTRLQLENVFQFRYADIPLYDGLTGILGPNGSGKSNLLLSARAALTNDFRCIAGVKADNVCQFAVKGDTSRIILHATHGDTPFTICRGLAGSVSWLECGAEPRIEGDKLIAARLQKLLGYPTEVLQEFVFVMQADLLSVCSETQDAVRLARWQRLFGLAWAETCYAAVGDFLTTYTVPVLTQPSSELELELATAQQAALTARAQFEELARCGRANWTADYQAHTDPSLTAERKRARQQQLVIAMRRSRATIQTARKAYTPLAAQLAALDTQWETANRWLQQNAIAIQQAEQQTAAYQAYTTAQTAYTDRLTARSELEQSLAAAVLPALFVGTCATEQETSLELGRLAASIASDTAILARAPTDGRCSHCNQPWVVPETERTAVQQRVLAAQLRHAQLTREATAWAANTRERQRIAGLRQQLEGRLQATPALPAPAVVTCDPANVVILAAAMTHRQTIANRQARDVLGRQVLQAARRLEDAERPYQRARLEHRRNRVTRTALARAEAYRQQRDTYFAEVQRRETELAVHDHRLADIQKRLTAAKTLEAAVAKKQAFRAQLMDARGHLHRDNLPKQLLRHRLETVVEDMNMLLDQQDTDYSVTLTDEMGFLVRFRDGRTQPAARLSKGQKAKLAMTCWLAINMSISGLNVLCLDEPTDGLDTANKAVLPTILEKLQTLGITNGLQCLIVTHEEEFSPYFDHVVRFTGLGEVEVS